MTDTFDNTIDLPEHVKALYVAMWTLPDGRIAGVHRLLFHWTLHVGIDDFGYRERYCYERVGDALADLIMWNGTGDPPGRWHKHPDTGRRRNPDTGFIWDEREPRDAKGDLIVRVRGNPR